MLDIVQYAIKDNKIVYTKFLWVKYQVVWLRFGLGFYTGVDIALDGEWPQVVVQHASTV